jgi:hypothetical protein
MSDRAAFHTHDTADYPAPRKYVLVVSCVDARLLDDLVGFLDHDNLTNRYYHATFAGAALALANTSKGDGPGPHWRQTFIDHVRATIVLTKGELTDIYIVQHEDCGAFKLFISGFEDMTPAEQLKLNRRYAKALQADIRKHFCAVYNPKIGTTHCRYQKKPPAVHAFFMDLRGGVQKLGPSYLPKAGEECKNYRCPCGKWADNECPPDDEHPEPGDVHDDDEG